MTKPAHPNTVALNRKAFHDFHILDKFEAGLCLTGVEVKSLRDGRASLSESYVRIIGNEAFLVNTHIPPFRHAQNPAIIDPKRTRKLLLHDYEIEKIAIQTNQKGFTIIPLSIYFKRGNAKVQIAVAQGKKTFDKREDLKKKTAQREMTSAVRRKQKS